MKNVRDRPLLIVLIVTFALSYPFFWQAYAIDDPFTIWLGQSIQQDPVRPYLFPSHWYDEPGTLFSDYRNPPFIGYVSCLVQTYVGQGEIYFHIVFSVFFLVSAVSMYILCQEWVRSSLAATIIFVSLPAVVVQSHHIMPDLACLAFFLAGLVLFRFALRNGNLLLFFGAGLIGGCSGLSKYHGLLWLPVMVLYFYHLKVRTDLIKPLLALLTAFLINAVWWFGSYWVYGQCHALASMSYCDVNFTELVIKALVMIVHLGGNMFILLVLARIGTIMSNVIILVFSACGTYILVEYYGVHDLKSGAMVFLFFYSGAMVLGQALFSLKGHELKAHSAIKGRGLMFLRAWLVLGCLVSIIFTPFMASRYLLLFLGPLIILYFRQGEAARGEHHGASRARIAVLGTIVLGTLISISDYHNSQAAKILTRSIAAEMRGEKLYFTGHWGFQYYMGKAGFETYSQNRQVQSGAYLAKTSHFSGQSVAEELVSNAVALKKIRLSPWFPLLVMDQRLQASMYIHYPGPLPWNYGRGEAIDIEIYWLLNSQKTSGGEE